MEIPAGMKIIRAREERAIRAPIAVSVAFGS